MAKDKGSNIRLGIFVFIGMIVTIIIIFLLGEKSDLFSSTFTVKAYFNDIQGLRSGASVRLSGINVGSVKDVEIIGDTTGKVEVTMSLEEDVKKFITTNTEATIETEGLVGNKVIILHIDRSRGEAIEDNGIINSREPISFTDIIEETKGIMEYTKEMTKNLNEIIARVNEGEGTIGKLFVDDDLYNQATQITEQADQSLKAITSELEGITSLFDSLGIGVQHVITNVNNVVSDIDVVLSDIKEGQGVLGSLLVEGSDYDTLIADVLQDIRQTTNDARLAASRLAENMEALKHNWLFKSYFENRGYWDKAEYEDEINNKLEELKDKIKILDKRINELKSFEAEK